MQHERYYLTEDKRVYMDSYIYDHSEEKPYQMEAWRKIKRPHNYWQIQKRPAIIIFPGGAYKELSEREGEAVALTFLREGFNTFVLYYSVGDYSAYPAPLIDASKAIWFVRQHAEEWHTDPDKIAVMGFSAGGHLAGLLATEWNLDGIHDKAGSPLEGNKPNAAILGYAPTMNEKLHDSTDVGTEVGKMISEQVPEYETYKYVTKDTCPMFIWTTWLDPLVSSANSLKMAEALAEQGVQYELHIFNRGTHGMSVCNNLSDYEAPEEVCPPNAKTWVPMCVQWLRETFRF